jgi:hypothetical protein
MPEPARSRSSAMLAFSRRRRAGLAASAVAGVAVCAFAGPAVAGGGQGRWHGGSLADPAKAHNVLADQPASITSTCFWGMPAGPLDGLNLLGPDTNVTYWYDRFQLPAGAKVVLHGRFPHARFLSLTSYGTVGGQRGTALGGLPDFEINPDRGSTNPFRSGAKRTAHRRSFTVTLSGEADPGAGSRAPNTFYVGQAGHTGETQTVELILRVYRADKNRNVAGGVRLPRPKLVLADGTTATGQGACEGVAAQSGFDKLSTVGIGVPPATYLSLLALPQANGAPALPTHPALDPIRFGRFFNTQYSLAAFYRGTVREPLIATLPTDVRPGLYPTPANAYATGYADRTFGPDPDGHNILVLHGKLPTHASTFGRNPRNDSAGKQVRYWSLCNYGSTLANPPLVPANTDCLFDEEIPTDRHGSYDIVVSLPQDRPRNATQRCGVAWMDWTAAGDGVPGGHPRLIALTMRNQLSDPSFAQGIDKVLTPGTEKQVMGDYLPDGAYTTKAQFEHRRCNK